MRNLRSHPTQRRDHYQELTDKIVAALEAGTAPWRRPWDPNACGGSNMPVNVATGHRYRGVNLFVLGMSPLTFTSGDPRWCSYRQAAARGWQVRKGEKATPIYFGTDKLAGVLGRLEQRRCRLEQPRDPRSMGLFRRLVREALPKIAVENGGPNLKQKMSAPL